MKEHKRMNIIIVAKPHATPWALDLKCWRMRAKLAGMALLCILCFGGAGFAAALLFVNPQNSALHELYAMRAQIEAQRQNLGQLESSSQRNLNALAVQLGSLQARALRLDAYMRSSAVRRTADAVVLPGSAMTCPPAAPTVKPSPCSVSA